MTKFSLGVVCKKVNINRELCSAKLILNILLKGIKFSSSGYIECKEILWWKQRLLNNQNGCNDNRVSVEDL